MFINNHTKVEEASKASIRYVRNTAISLGRYKQFADARNRLLPCGNVWVLSEDYTVSCSFRCKHNKD